MTISSAAILSRPTSPSRRFPALLARTPALCLVLASTVLAACGGPPMAPSRPVTGPETEALTFFQSLYEPWRAEGDPLEPRRLLERLGHHRVPGISVAVIDDGELRWAKAWGYAEADRPLTPDDLFQVGSVSKLVAATAALRLSASDEAGLRLDLDLARAADLQELGLDDIEGATLRRLLSHTAGLEPASYAGYPRGAELPGLEEILTGRAPSTGTPLRQPIAPGTAWRYSGGGYELLERWLEVSSGRDFGDWLGEEILRPLEMTSSGFAAPTKSAAALGHDSLGEAVPGGWRLYPERAAAGLWSTAADLAAWVADIQKSQAGKPRRRLDRDTTLALLEPQEPGGWGLGPQLGGTGHASWFGHLGAAAGYRAFVLGFISSGDGAVILTNGDGGLPLIREAITGLAELYSWPAFRAESRPLRGVEEGELAALAGVFEIEGLPGLELELRPIEPSPEDAEDQDREVLELRVFGEVGRLLAAEDGGFFDREHGFEVEILEHDEDGLARRIELRTFPAYRFEAIRPGDEKGSTQDG